MAKDVHIARSVAVAAETDAPVIALADERWAEALVIGRRFGLDPQTMIAIINASTGRSFVSELVFGPEVLTGRYGTGFALGLMAKDVHIARSVAAAAETDAPVIALADER